MLSENVRSLLLRQADEAINGPRATDYGDVHTNFGVIADMWTVYLGRRGIAGELQPEDVSLMMTLVKIARLAGQPGHWDSWLDIAGYAALGAEVAERGGKQ